MRPNLASTATAQAEGAAKRRRASPSWSLVVKVLGSGAMLFWLSRTGTLNAQSLSVLLRSAPVCLATIGLWAVVTALLSTVRWRWVLRMVGGEVPFGRALGLQLMGQFFNVAFPGNVGGDVVKNYYVMPSRRAAIACAAFVERYVGLLGLFLVALLFQFSLALPPRAASLLLVLDALVLAMASGLVALVGGVRWLDSHPIVLIGWPARFIALAKEFRPASIGRSAVVSLVVSVVMHLISIAYFALIASVLRGEPVPMATVAPIYPVGMLTVVLPISVGGLGVGHLAFEELFSWVGLDGGANTFNVFIVGILAPSVLGVIPYLTMKAAAKPEP